MNANPESQHRWLQRFVGEWAFEGECGGPDGEAFKSSGTEHVRALGELWVVGESDSTLPDGTGVTSVITLGYEPQKSRFVGTFVASVMNQLWVYDQGSLDASGRVLTLECDGPSFAGDGETARYRDVFEFVDDDRRVLRAFVLGEDGNWTQFMTTDYRRIR